MVEWEGYGNEVSFERIFDEKAYRGGGGAIFRAVKEYALEKRESRPLTLERLGSLSDSCISTVIASPYKSFLHFCFPTIK